MQCNQPELVLKHQLFLLWSQKCVSKHAFSKTRSVFYRPNAKSHLPCSLCVNINTKEIFDYEQRAWANRAALSAWGFDPAFAALSLKAAVGKLFTFCKDHSLRIADLHAWCGIAVMNMLAVNGSFSLPDTRFSHLQRKSGIRRFVQGFVYKTRKHNHP